MSELYVLGELSEPYTLDSDQDLWILQIDYLGLIGSMDTHVGIIEVRGESKNIVYFLAQQIIDKLNDPKVQFLQELKVDPTPDWVYPPYS